MGQVEELHLNIGALMLSSWLSIFLFGVITVQTHTYFSRFPTDPWHLRYLVSVTWVLQMTFTALASNLVWDMIQHLKPRLELSSTPATAAIFTYATIGWLFQSYFAYRAWKLATGPLRTVPVLCFITCLGRFVVIVWIGGNLLSRQITVSGHGLVPWMISHMSMATCLDITYTLLLCFGLWNHRRSGLPRTRKALDRLIASSFKTGLLMSIASCASLICYITLNDTHIWQGIEIIFTKLYSLSLLNSLNLRSQICPEKFSAEEVAPTPAFPTPLAFVHSS